MPAYLHPGVYIEEIPSGVRPIGSVSTSIAAFIGKSGTGTVGEPVLVHKWDDYTEAFGEVTANTDVLGLAVSAFYSNGGKSAYIVRVDNAATLAKYKDIFAILKKIRDISIIVLPGLVMKTNSTIIDEAINHCTNLKNRMVIVDPVSGKELVTQANITTEVNPTASPYSALYYPWVVIANPLFDPDADPPSAEPPTLKIAPSAFAAAIWAKTDSTRGVWKAPAGIATGLLGAAGPEFIVEDEDQDQLNPAGVNALRKLPGAGLVIWGARTTATKTDPEWRYIPVKRTAIMIERSIYEGMQWAVFETNDHRLWSSLRLNIEAFMDTLFRAGAFQGEKASDAYFVRCGLGDTMKQADIDAGQVIVIVGFAPLKPAEFVIVRIQQMVGQQ